MSAQFFRDLQGNTIVPADVLKPCKQFAANKRFVLIKAIALGWFSPEEISERFGVTHFEFIKWCKEFNLDPIETGVCKKSLSRPIIDPIVSGLIILSDEQNHFTRNEISIMNQLANSAGQVITYERLFIGLYENKGKPSSGKKILNVYIDRVRKKLDSLHPNLGSMVEIMRGRGYRINPNLEIVTEAYETLKTSGRAG